MVEVSYQICMLGLASLREVLSWTLTARALYECSHAGKCARRSSNSGCSRLFGFTGDPLQQV
eukprot:531713-Pleurochrysis_carterae.AAC.2